MAGNEKEVQDNDDERDAAGAPGMPAALPVRLP